MKTLVEFFLDYKKENPIYDGRMSNEYVVKFLDLAIEAGYKNAIYVKTYYGIKHKYYNYCYVNDFVRALTHYEHGLIHVIGDRTPGSAQEPGMNQLILVWLKDQHRTFKGIVTKDEKTADTIFKSPCVTCPVTNIHRYKYIHE